MCYRIKVGIVQRHEAGNLALMLLQERGQLSQIVSTVLFVLVEGQAVSDYLVDEAGIELIGLSVVDLVDLLD